MSDGAAATLPALELETLQGEKVALRDPAAAARLIVVYKHDCETCQTVLPVIERVSRAFHGKKLLTLGVSQSDADATLDTINEHGLCFPQALDADLALSFALELEVVPVVLLATPGGDVIARSDALDLPQLTGVLTNAARLSGVDERVVRRALAAFELPAFRPGCASRTLDPGVQRARTATQGAAKLQARRWLVGDDQDVVETLFERGLTDGLPVVPPTEERVLRMLEGTTRDPQDVVAVVPPNLTPATVEKVAINAVMAGCKPEYLPVVLAAVEAACTDEFNMHGVLATTYFAAPLIVVNGPVRARIGMNSGINVFGQGNRANATIGRALNLVVRNVGGGRPGEVDRATLGQPGKYTYCIAENEEASPWPALHVERGFAPGDSTVTLFAAEAPRAIVDQTSRSARGLATSLGLAMRSVMHPRAYGLGDVVLVLAPEHVETLKRDGWSKDDLRRHIQEVTTKPLAELLADDECREGLPAALAKGADPATVRLAKFRKPDAIHVVVAGGPAGKFAAVIGGWVPGPMGSTMVTRKIDERDAPAA
ncbi:MAG: redoxin domain-containing protein [Thermodesulfobacteriota bacterium]